MTCMQRLLVAASLAMLLLGGSPAASGQQPPDSLAELHKVIRDLQAEVAALRKELDSLKREVAELRKEAQPPDEGRGLGSRPAHHVARDREIGVSLSTPPTVQKLQTALHAKNPCATA